MGTKGAAGGTAAQKGRHGRKCRMDIGEVRQMLKDGYGVGDIQKHLKLIPVRKGKGDPQ